MMSLTLILLFFVTFSAALEVDKRAEYNGDFILSTMRYGSGIANENLPFGATKGENLVQLVIGNNNLIPNLDNKWKEQSAIYVFFIGPKKVTVPGWELSKGWNELGTQISPNTRVPDRRNINGFKKDTAYLIPIYVGETDNVWRRFQEHKSVSNAADTIASNFFSNKMGLDSDEWDLYFAWSRANYQNKFSVVTSEWFFLQNFDFPRNVKDNGKKEKRRVEQNVNALKTFSDQRLKDTQQMLFDMVFDVARIKDTVDFLWTSTSANAIDKERMEIMENTDYKMKDRE